MFVKVLFLENLLHIFSVIEKEYFVSIVQPLLFIHKLSYRLSQ